MRASYLMSEIVLELVQALYEEFDISNASEEEIYKTAQWALRGPLSVSAASQSCPSLAPILKKVPSKIHAELQSLLYDRVKHEQTQKNLLSIAHHVLLADYQNSSNKENLPVYTPSLKPAMPPPSLPNLAEKIPSDPELVKALVYSFQGISSDFLQEVIPGQFELTDLAIQKLSQSQQDLLFDLKQLSDSYVSICAMLNETSESLLVLNLHAFIKSQLNDYESIAVLLDSKTASGDHWSLLQISAWTHNTKRNMKMIWKFLTDCHETSDTTQLLNYLYERAVNSHKKFYETVFFNVYSQWVKKFVYPWIFDGELNGKHSEFFGARQKTGDVSKLLDWENSFIFDQSKIPTFISIELAKKIFLIGKHKHFERASTTSFNSKIPETSEFRDLDLFTFISSLEKDIIEASDFCQLLSVLVKDFDVYGYLQLVTDFLLFSNGEFVELLIEHGNLLLSGPSNKLKKHDCLYLLDSICGKFGKSYRYLDRLNVKIAKSSAGDFGWDVFCLDVAIEDLPAVQIVLNSEKILKKCRRISGFLMKLVRAEQAIRSKIGGERDDPCWYLVRGQLWHVVHVLRGFFCGDVISREFLKFQTSKNFSTDVEGLVVNFEKFILSAMDGCFLTEPSEELLDFCHQIFLYCEQFGISDDRKVFEDIRTGFKATMAGFIKELEKPKKPGNVDFEDLQIGLVGKLNVNGFFAKN
jgi:Gamma tubulin complex component N-terminal